MAFTIGKKKSLFIPQIWCCLWPRNLTWYRSWHLLLISQNNRPKAYTSACFNEQPWLGWSENTSRSSGARYLGVPTARDPSAETPGVLEVQTDLSKLQMQQLRSDLTSTLPLFRSLEKKNVSLEQVWLGLWMDLLWIYLWHREEVLLLTPNPECKKANPELIDVRTRHSSGQVTVLLAK